MILTLRRERVWPVCELTLSVVDPSIHPMKSEDYHQSPTSCTSVSWGQKSYSQFYGGLCTKYFVSVHMHLRVYVYMCSCVCMHIWMAEEILNHHFSGANSLQLPE